MNAFTLTVIDDLLTTVGGYEYDGKNTNKLFSLTGEGSSRRWTEKFPPMPTKRYAVSALCTGTALIVAGECDDYGQPMKTVKVLNNWRGVPQRRMVAIAHARSTNPYPYPYPYPGPRGSPYTTQ